MTPPFLLDTNTCIAYLRKSNANVINRIQARPPDELRLCSVVVAELYFGAFKSPQPAKNFSLLATFLPVFLSLPFEDRAAKLYGQIRADLEARGTPIGPNDLMIAAIARSDIGDAQHRGIRSRARLKLVDWHVP